MSMKMLTLLQLTGISCAWLLVTLGLPAFVFERRLRSEHRLTERIMFYFMIGNFYLMNLVFVLQLLKISYLVTLILGTLVPTVWGRIWVNKIPVKSIAGDLARTLRRVSEGLMGGKTLLSHLFGAAKKKLAAFCRMIGRFLFRRTFDFLLTLLLLVALMWLYGGNILEQYGYKASDLLVHNYWINAMNENHIFVAGVYPHGFHCIVYYLHAVFGFDTYVILRVFAFSQNVMIHFMLLSFLKLCCKSRYAAYIGTFFYTISSCFAVNTYSRFYATLPQEFGMLFIFPAIYFGFAYFEERKKELAEESAKETKKGRFRLLKSHIDLAGFAMSFSMTMAVHFYGTMIAGLFCVAMAVGYCFLFFRRKYFWNVVGTCAISVLIAVLPMALAFMGGTPLQGSLGWGLNVITGGGSNQNSSGNGENSGGTVSPAPDGSTVGTVPGTSVGEVGTGENLGEGVNPSAPPKTSIVEKVGGLLKGCIAKLQAGWKAIYYAINASVLRLRVSERIYWIMASFFVLIVLGILFLLLKQRCYGSMLISAGIYMLLLCVMMTARTWGLPALMDSNRGSIYFAYSLPIAFSFLVDAVLHLCFLPMKRKWLRNICSGICVILTVGFLWQSDQLKVPRDTKAQILNEAVTCLTNIIKEEDDFTWTIVSANDETQMGFDHGYHYETIVFLENMEVGRATLHSMSQALIRIPTKTVYFFIEKVPVDYSVRYEGLGQSVSEEGAAKPLPPNSGIRMYQGEKRWIVMSRMYYWAQEFRKLYPNEVDVYLETDEFVCYRIEQNPYRLYNFAIDYGYNVPEAQATK